MYAVLDLLGASWSFLFLPPSARVAAMVGSWGDASGGGEVGASCFRVSSYFAFSSAYLYAIQSSQAEIQLSHRIYSSDMTASTLAVQDWQHSYACFLPTANNAQALSWGRQ